MKFKTMIELPCEPPASTTDLTKVERLSVPLFSAFLDVERRFPAKLQRKNCKIHRGNSTWQRLEPEIRL